MYFMIYICLHTYVRMYVCMYVYNTMCIPMYAQYMYVPDLLLQEGFLPIHFASIYGHVDMVRTWDQTQDRRHMTKYVCNYIMDKYYNVY